MREDDSLTDDYLRNIARPMLEAIFSDTGGARDDLLDSLTQYAHWRIDVIRGKLEESEKYKELQEEAGVLESRLKSQICARQWEIAQEWSDTRYTLDNMHNEMFFLARAKEGIALRRALDEFK